MWYLPLESKENTPYGFIFSFIDKNLISSVFLPFVEIRLRLYGSSCTKFGFKDSDVNIDIQYPPHVSSSEFD